MTASFESTEYTPDSLVATNAALLSGRKVTIKSGENLERGAVLGKDGDDKYLLSLSGATDGSETPDMILAEDVDASDGDASALAYERGDFREDALILGADHTIASIREGLRGKGIFIV
ncbi:MAG: head decoration protein [Guyparkeria sp.]